MVILYNVIPERERFYQIRDILNRYEYSLRLVIIGGINAIDYFDNYLRHPVSGMIHLTGTKKPFNYYVETRSDEEDVYPVVFGKELEDLFSNLADKVKVNGK